MPTLPLVIVLAIIGTRMPALNAEVLANVLDVGDQVPSSVRFQRRVCRALTTAMPDCLTPPVRDGLH